MKGDISRETFDVAKHYSGVRMQQGRVQTDADWNEQEALQRRRAQIEARDVIGRCGAPEDNAGFAISIAGGALKIGAGRYYVDGILCENETDGLVFESQPDLCGATQGPMSLVTEGACWRISTVERHRRRRCATSRSCSGADTATRVKTVRVRVLPPP
jgi:hypothetical protein